MHIAIYANTGPYPESLQAQLRQFLQDRQLTGEVSRFSSADALVHAIGATRFDLIFFILEDGESGFAAAQAVRERCMTCEILFIAGTPQHAPRALEFRAMGYLLLPLDDAQLRSAMDRFLRERRRPEHPYAVHTRQCDYLVPHKKIRYFRSQGHTVCVYIEGEAQPLSHLRRLDDIERETAALAYVRCHQSYLVNRRVIRGVSSRYLMLIDGQRIPVSRKYAAQLSQLQLPRISREG